MRCVLAPRPRRSAPPPLAPARRAWPASPPPRPARRGSRASPRPRPARPLTKGVASDPRDHEPERDEDQVAARLRTWDVRDDDHHAAEHDREADARLPLVAEVPEQERGCQPHDAETADERDQHAVDVREPRGQQPVGGGPAKGKRRRANSGSTRIATAGTENHRTSSGRPASPPDDELEHSGNGEDRDQELEPVLLRDGPNPGHAVNVLQLRACRLLPQ